MGIRKRDLYCASSRLVLREGQTRGPTKDGAVTSLMGSIRHVKRVPKVIPDLHSSITAPVSPPLVFLSFPRCLVSAIVLRLGSELI